MKCSRWVALAIVVFSAVGVHAQRANWKDQYGAQDYMILARDGTKLKNVVFVPKDKPGPFPILLERTPYGAGSAARPPQRSTAKITEAGYILVVGGGYRRIFDLSWEFELKRPERRLTEPEAHKWAQLIRDRSWGMSLHVGPRDPSRYVRVATALRPELSRMLVTGSRVAIAEVVIRRDRDLIPALKSLAMEGSGHALTALIAITPARRALTCLEVLKGAPKGSVAVDLAAYELLGTGDPRGVPVLRDAVATHRSFGGLTGGGWVVDSELCYRLVRFADKSNVALIAKDLDMGGTSMRRYFPALARLKRPAVDKVLLKHATHTQHAYRKWVAMAARERPESREYRKALGRLASDPVRDVRDTALSILGRGSEPTYKPVLLFRR